MKQMRDAIAKKSSIADEGIMGWVAVCCLGLCSIIQETKELGLDPMAKAMGEQTIERVWGRNCSTNSKFQKIDIQIHRIYNLY